MAVRIFSASISMVLVCVTGRHESLISVNICRKDVMLSGPTLAPVFAADFYEALGMISRKTVDLTDPP